MSKLDTLANKIAEKMMPKMRRMVREELDYKLDKISGGNQVMHDKSTGSSQSRAKRKGSPDAQNVNEQARGGDFSKVAEGMGLKQKFQNINGDTVVDPNETFEDKDGKVHKMGELMQDPNAQKVMENVNKDYSNLID